MPAPAAHHIVDHHFVRNFVVFKPIFVYRNLFSLIRKKFFYNLESGLKTPMLIKNSLQQFLSPTKQIEPPNFSPSELVFYSKEKVIHIIFIHSGFYTSFTFITSSLSIFMQTAGKTANVTVLQNRSFILYI